MINLINNDIEINCKGCNAKNKTKFSKIMNSNPKCGKCRKELDISSFLSRFNVIDSLDKILRQDDLGEFFLENKKGEDFHKLSDKISILKRTKDKLFSKKLPITIVVTGEFNSGKSYVINSLIGERLIPTGTEPMTLAPSIFRYNDELRISIETNDGKNIEISKEEFSEIKHTNKSGKIDFKNIKMIHFEYNYPKLAQIHIIDTPGFNTSTQKDDDEKTMEIIKNYADVVLWVFNANHGTSKDSEKTLLNSIRSLFLQKEKSIKTKNDFKKLSENINVPIIALLNQIDVKGTPDSLEVQRILNDIKKETSIETIIPYSAEKTLVNKEKSLEIDLLKLIKENILTSDNNDFSISVKSDRSGNKKLKILKEDNNIIFESQVKDNIIWEKQSEILDQELSIIREKARENLVFSFFNDFNDLKNELRLSIEEIFQKIENEKKIIIKLFDHQITEIERFTKIIDNKINQYQNEIEYKLKNNIPQILFYFEVQEGFIYNTKRIKLNHYLQRNSDEHWILIYNTIVKSFDLESFIKKESSVFENIFDTLISKINDEDFFNNLWELKNRLSDIKNNCLTILEITPIYLVHSNIIMMRNSIVNKTNSITIRDAIVDYKIDFSDNYLSEAYFKEIFDESNFDIIFIYLKEFLKNQYKLVSYQISVFKDLFKNEYIIAEFLEKTLQDINNLG